MEKMTSPVKLSKLNYGWTDFLCVQTVYGSYPVTLQRRKIIDLYVTLLLVRLQIFIINPVFNQFNFIEFEGFSLSCFLLTVVPVIICPLLWERGRIRVYWGYWGHTCFVMSSVETSDSSHTPPGGAFTSTSKFYSQRKSYLTLVPLLLAMLGQYSSLIMIFLKSTRDS